MGYSRNKMTLLQRLPWLVELKQGKACHWQVENGTAQRFAYWIRESLFIAALYPQEFPELADAQKRFRIEVVSPGLVQARLGSGASEVQVMRGEAAPTHGLENAIAVQMSGPQTAESVIQHILNTAPANEKYSWSQAFLSEEDLVAVWQWCLKQTPPWLMFEYEGQLTIQRWERDLAAHSWNPEDIGMEIDDETRSLLNPEGSEGHLGTLLAPHRGQLRPDRAIRPDSPRGIDGDIDPADRPKDGTPGSYYRQTRREEVRGTPMEGNGSAEDTGPNDEALEGTHDSREDEVV